MQVRRCRDADEFLDRAGEFLAAREAEHNLILGLSGRLRDDPHTYGDEQPYFAVVEDGGQVVGAAMRTPPHNLILSELDDAEALELIANDVRAVFSQLPGVLGPNAAAKRFVSLWGAPGNRVISQRAHCAESVIPPSGVPGRMRDYGDG